MAPIFVILWVICAIGGWAIGNSKGRAVQGFWLGLLLSVIGLIIIAGLAPRVEGETTALPAKRMMGESNRVYQERIAAIKNEE